LWGNDISIALNIYGEESPDGLSAVVVNMSGGAGTPDIQDALDGMGTGDGANEDFFTDVINGYGKVTSTLDAIATYVGLGNTLIGLYSELVARPFRSLTGDVVAGSAGLTAISAIGNARKTDRANGIISVPDSKSHPEEIAAQAMGIMARINNNRAEEHYVDQILVGIHPGDKGSNRWTSEYSNRDTAVKAGISPTLVKSGVVVLQNVVSFYHPDSVPIVSNGYRSMRNISIIQNVLNSIKTTFEATKWQGISIVDDVVKVTNPTDRLLSRDIDDVRSDLVVLVRAWEGNAWIYQGQFTIDRLKIAGAISVRAGTNGFDSIVPVIFSGEGLILNALVQFDTSIAALN
jgi:phage tail sheath gpL-like